MFAASSGTESFTVSFWVISVGSEGGSEGDGFSPIEGRAKAKPCCSERRSG